MNPVKTVIFDLGGVLIDWNPRYLYRKILKDENEVDFFLNNICTSEWNDQQDAGRSFEEATLELIRKHPEWEEAISAWYGRWQETIRGPIDDTVEVLQKIKESGNYRLYALTNWSAETFPWAYKTFEFLLWFEGIVVSGDEKTRKPFPEFYQILFDRYQVDPGEAIFIDDNIKNVEGAKDVGMRAIHFQSAEQLKKQLPLYGIVI
jgi:2-haloacid dehalogenase